MNTSWRQSGLDASNEILKTTFNKHEMYIVNQNY